MGPGKLDEVRHISGGKKQRYGMHDPARGAAWIGARRLGAFPRFIDVLCVCVFFFSQAFASLTS